MQEEQRKREEEEQKKQENELAFQAWLVRKREQLHDERRLQRAQEMEKMSFKVWPLEGTIKSWLLMGLWNLMAVLKPWLRLDQKHFRVSKCKEWTSIVDHGKLDKSSSNSKNSRDW